MHLFQQVFLNLMVWLAVTAPIYSYLYVKGTGNIEIIIKVIIAMII